MTALTLTNVGAACLLSFPQVAVALPPAQQVRAGGAATTEVVQAGHRRIDLRWLQTILP